MPILAAARAAFGDYGYTATTIASIALRAGVSEARIFRDFGTKEALFDAAVLTPFTEFATRHLAEWEDRIPGSTSAVDEAELLLNRLIDLFIEERDVVLPLLAAYQLDGASAKLRRRLEDAMRGIVLLVEKRMIREASARGYGGFDIAPLTRIMVGVCFSLVTFPALFDMGRIPRSRIVHEMSHLTVRGVEVRSAGLQPETSFSSTVSSVDLSDQLPSEAPWVDDQTWASIASTLANVRPKGTHGRRPIDDRRALAGIIDVLTSGRPWRDLPARKYRVSGVTCWRRLRAWQDNGIWPVIADELRSNGIELPSSISRRA